jgi:hypothetical protein
MSPLGLIVLVTMSLATQEQPDFSGRWVLAVPAQPGRDSPPVLSVSQSLARTTIRGDPMKPFFKDITIERQLETGSFSESHAIGVESGSVAGPQPGGPKTIHRVRWEGTSLVFEDGRYTGQSPGAGAWDERREVWSLDPDGALRIVIAVTSSAAEPRTVTLVYRRAR